MRVRPRDNFYYLLVCLLLLVLVAPVTNRLAGELSIAVLELSFSVVLLLALGSLQASRRGFIAGVALIVLNLLFSTGTVVTGYHGLSVASMYTSLVFLLLTTMSAASQVFRSDRINFNTVVGAVCIYLLLGLIWSISYRLLGDAVPGSFTGLDQYQGNELYWRYLYFSFVTLTTLGYGDVSPVNAYSETLVVLEAVIGQMYLTVLIAGLVGAYLSDRSVTPGLLDSESAKGDNEGAPAVQASKSVSNQ